MPRKPSMTTAAVAVSFIAAAGALTQPGIRANALGILAGPPPEVVAVNTEVARFPDDGLVRLIVTPLADASAPESSAATLGAAELEGDTDLPIDSAADEADRPTVVYGHPVVDALAGERAVESVTPIGNGSFAVVTSDAAVVDPNLFAILDDVPMATTGEPHQGYQWALENDGSSLARVGSGPAQLADVDIDWSAAMGVATGEGIVVAIIDSGIDTTHTDIAGSLWTNPNEHCGNGDDDDGNGFVDDCGGWDFGNNDNKPYDMGANSHGTHVGGIVSADVNGIGVAGVAPLSELMNLNVETRSGSGSYISLSSVAAAVRYAADNGADIVNMSLGTSPGTSLAAVQVLGDAIAYAGDRGVIVVVSAGNNGVNLDSTAIYPASFDLPNMVVVGASSPTDERASFSNYSTSIVDIFAPGEYILSTTPTLNYEFMSGTSQAAPIVAGVLALVRQAEPELSPAAVVQRVLDGAEVVDALAPWGRAGARVNAAGALGVEGATNSPLANLREPEITVTGLDTIEELGGGAFVIDAGIAFDVPAGYFDEEFGWEVALVADVPVGPAALLDYPLTIDGTATSTGETGAAELGSSDTASASIETTLPEGRYAFLFEAIPTDDPTTRLGAPFAVSFSIDEAGTISDVTDGSTGSGAGNSGPTTTAPPSTPTTSTPGSAGAGGTTTTTAASTDPVDDEPWWIDWEPIGSGATTTLPSGGTGGTGGTDPAPTTTAPAATQTPTTVRSGQPGSGGTTATTTQWWVTTTTRATNAAGGVSTTTPTTTPGLTSTTQAPTTSSSGSTGSGSGQPDPGSDSAASSNGEWAITGLSTQVGFVNSTSYVTLYGSFPDEVYVWFGDSPGTVVSQRSRTITVLTPVTSRPGIVDISLRRTPNEIVLTAPQAFAFWDLTSDDGWYEQPGSGSAGATTTTSPSSNSGGNNGATTTTAPGTSSGATSSTTAPAAGGSDGSTDDGGETTTSRSPRTSRSRLGDRTDLGNGLSGGVLLDVDPFAWTTECSSSTCPAPKG